MFISQNPLTHQEWVCTDSSGIKLSRPVRSSSPGDKPTIAFVVEWFYPILGGAGIQAERLARQLQNHYRILILTKHPSATSSTPGVALVSTPGVAPAPIYRFGPSAPSTPGVAPADSPGVNPAKHYPNRLADYQAALKLFTWLFNHRQEINLIHIHGNLENNFASGAILFAKLTRKPILGKPAMAGELEKHLESTRYSPIQKLRKNLNPLNRLRRSLARKLNHYQAISTTIQDELLRLNINPQKISYLPNGIDPDRFFPASQATKEKWRRKLKIPKTSLVFLTVSRLAAHKGILHPLLAMWQKDFADRKDCRLLIIGSGEGLASSVEDEVKEFVKNIPGVALADSAGVPKQNVRLLGRQEDVLPYYQASDIFIQPSENEGLSNSLLEAASCGLICVASNVSGNTDSIQDNQTGFIFQSGRPDHLKEKIDQALSQRTNWRTITQKARNTVRKHFSLAQTASQLAVIYQKLISANKLDTSDSLSGI